MLEVSFKDQFFSKCFESFLRDWIMPIISPFLHEANYGGLKGDSPVFYHIHLLHFIHTNVSNRSSPHAVLMAQADIKRAFNSVSHQHIITGLYDMQVPGWILRIIFSYLTDRNMTLKFRGTESSKYSLKG